MARWREHGLRVVVGLATAVLAAPAAGFWLYGVFHPGQTSVLHALLGGLLTQLWSLALVSQALLGWWPADGEREPMTALERVLAFLGGVALIGLTVLLLAYVGHSVPEI